MSPRRAPVSQALVIASLALATLHAAQADPVSVAVAANFTAPMQKIASAFEADTGHKAELSFGATGKFYAQITHGAPFQVLLSADDTTPARLEREGKAVARSRFTYAIGTLVLWSAQPGYVDAQGAVLKTGDFKHLAIANPKVAPYGAAALQVLDQLGATAAVQPRLVQGENIAQTAQFVQTGNATVGIIALSLALNPALAAQGGHHLIDAALHAPLEQGFILTRQAEGKALATAFADYIGTAAARAVLVRYGFELPAEKSAARPDARPDAK